MSNIGMRSRWRFEKFGLAGPENPQAIMDSFGGKMMKFRALPTTIAPRQMSLLFDCNGLEGLEVLERSKVAAALARILMLAAGLRIEELNDDEL